MMKYELDSLMDDADREDEDQQRSIDPKFKKRRRPDYCRKRTPARSGISQRNNWRRTR